MADKHEIDRNLLKFHIKEEYCPTNIKIEEVDEELIKTETEVSGGSWVYQNEDINELLANEKRTLENSEEQLLNGNAGINKETFEGDSKIWERTNNLSANRSKKNNENGLDFDNENTNFDGEMESQQNLIENVKINNKKEKIKFLHKDNDCLSTGNLKKRVLVCQEKCENDDMNVAKSKNQISECNHYNAAEKEYKCVECSYVAVNKSNLVSHIKYRHTIKKPYKCNECSYAAGKKSTLLTHIKFRHTMEKPYKCDECSYTAVNKSNLVSHIKYRHTMEKPYKCNQCAYGTVTSSNLLTHIKSRHTM